MSIGKDLGFAEPRRRAIPDKNLVLPACLVGMEFEFENVRDYPDPTLDWSDLVQRANDGSLRNNGKEFIFARPLFGRDVTEVVEGLCREANRLGYVASLRTGIHIHVDARDITYETLRWWIVLNCLLEPALYRWVGDGRDENVFCLPWYNTEGLIGTLRKIYRATGQSLHAYASSLNHRKYSGFNLDPLSRQGSVEYRQLRTTTDTKKILDWLNICLRNKAAAVQLAESGKNPASFTDWADGTLAWSGLLGAQYRQLYYPNFLKDILDKGYPLALEITREPVGGFTKKKDFDNQGVRSFLTTKAPASTDAPRAPMPFAPLELAPAAPGADYVTLITIVRRIMRGLRPTAPLADPAPALPLQMGEAQAEYYARLRAQYFPLLIDYIRVRQGVANDEAARTWIAGYLMLADWRYLARAAGWL